MGILSRLKSIFMAKANTMLNEIENPEEAIEISLVEMRNQIKQVKKALLEVTTIKKSLEGDLQNVNLNIKLVQEQAELSMQANREELAKAALEKKQNLIEQKEKVTVEIENLKEKIKVINENKQQLENRVNELETKKQELFALNKAADAQLTVKEIISGISSDMTDINERLERAENKISHKNARLEAMDEIIENEGFNTLDETKKIEFELKNIQREERIRQELEALRIKNQEQEA